MNVRVDELLRIVLTWDNDGHKKSADKFVSYDIRKGISTRRPFYPDMILKVCKSDGNQGKIPLLFSTAHECCDNKLMDYDKCISYATSDTNSVSTTATTSTSTVYNSPPPTQLPTQKPR